MHMCGKSHEPVFGFYWLYVCCQDQRARHTFISKLSFSCYSESRPDALFCSCAPLAVLCNLFYAEFLSFPSGKNRSAACFLLRALNRPSCDRPQTHRICIPCKYRTESYQLGFRNGVESKCRHIWCELGVILRRIPKVQANHTSYQEHYQRNQA